MLMVVAVDFMLHDLLCICVQKYSICSTAKKMTGVSVTSLQWRYVIRCMSVIENLTVCVMGKSESCGSRTSCCVVAIIVCRFSE